MSLGRYAPRLVGSLAATAGLQVVAFASGVLVARLLGPTDRGYAAQILAWYGFLAPLALVGVDEAAVYFLSRRDVRVGLGSVLAAVAGTAVLGLAASAAAFFLVFAGLGAHVRQAALIFLIYPPLFHAFQVGLSALQAGHRPVAWNMARVSVTVLYTLFVLALGLAGAASLAGIMAAHVAALATGAVVALVTALRGGGRLGLPQRTAVIALFGFGRFTVFQRLTIVARDNLDRMLLPLFVGMADLGQYAVAASLAYTVFLIGLTVDQVAFPAIAGAEDAERPLIAGAFVRLGLLGTVLAVAVALAVVDVITPLAFGRAFTSAAGLAKPLLVAGGLQSAKMLFGSVLKGMNRPRIIAAVEVWYAPSMAVALIVFAPIWGVLGGAIAQLLASGLTAVALAMAILVRTDVTWRDLFVPRRSDLAALLGGIGARAAAPTASPPADSAAATGA